MNSGIRLQTNEYDRLLKTIEQVYEKEHPDTFPEIVPLLNQLVPSDYAAFNEVPRPRAQEASSKKREVPIKSTCYPSSMQTLPHLFTALSRHIEQHPILSNFEKTQNGHTYKISDFLNPNQFHRLDLYNEYYRHMGVKFQMFFFLNIGPDTLILINLNRCSKDFSEKDRLMLSLIRPHLVKAYRKSRRMTRYREERSLLESAIEQEERGVIQVGWDGTIESITAFARLLLAHYFNLSPQGAHRLPLLLQKWLEGSAVTGDQEQDQHLTFEKDEKTLFIQLFFAKGFEQPILLLKELKNQSTSSTRPAQALGLTPREGEVLHWVTMGKTNQEVGSILGIRSGTVRNHLEHVYKKLGVKTRTAAAAVYQGHSPNPTRR